MRAALLPLLILLADCGSKEDLIIGELASFAASGTPGAAAGAAGTAGAEPTGGAVSLAGSPNTTGGMVNTAGMDMAGGADGSTGGSNEDCVDGSEPPPGSLLHRYRFDETGTTARDAISGANAEVIGTALDGSGLVTMDGNSRQYVDLPNGIVSALSEVTLVTWTTWSGGAAYQRVLDFGITDEGEGVGGSGRSYLAVMPMTGFENQAKPGLGAEIKVPGFPTVTLASTEDMHDRAAQVSLVFKSGVSAALYLDGSLLARKPTTIKLSDIDDRNNWLGQSQHEDNPFYEGSFEELRIYDVALDACQLHTLLVRGPESP